MGELLTAIFQARAEERPARGARTEDKREGAGYGGAFLLPEQEQLRKYADAFYGLARLFQDMPCQKEKIGDGGLQDIFAEAREAACRTCPGQGQCWGNGYFATCRMLYEMAKEAQEGGVSLALVRELSGQCSRAGELADAVAESCARARQELLWNNRLLELRTAVGEQIFQTAELMRQMAGGFEEVTGPHRDVFRKLRRNLAYLKVRAEKMKVFRCADGRLEVFLSLRAAQNVCVSAKTVAEVLSDCWKEGMCPARDCRAAVLRERCNFHFVPDTRYQLFCGISSITKAGEVISGDNFSLLQKDNGQVAMSLADGMGSGMGAYRESEKVIGLLEQFLEAGFPQETAVRMVNSCMLLQSRSQGYSTIDLCMVDLHRGTCDLLKAGASSTYLVRGEEIETISAGSLPAGVLWQSDYESLHRELQSGDTIIMMTDGVLGAVPEEGREQAMRELIRKAANPNAKEYARRLMEKVYLMQKMEPGDDMTVLVGSIWKK